MLVGTKSGQEEIHVEDAQSSGSRKNEGLGVSGDRVIRLDERVQSDSVRYGQEHMLSSFDLPENIAGLLFY